MKSGLLIASPQMRDPNFEGTVVLLCQHDDEGAIGMVINREGPVPIGAVTRQVKVASPPNAEEMTWWGGPVGTDTCFVIWRGASSPAVSPIAAAASEQEGWNVGEIAVSSSLERLERLVQTGRPFHVTIGYAGWSSFQLAYEIERGSWLYLEPDAERSVERIVFDTPLEDRYAQALALLGLTQHTVWMTPIDE